MAEKNLDKSNRSEELQIALALVRTMEVAKDTGAGTFSTTSLLPASVAVEKGQEWQLELGRVSKMDFQCRRRNFRKLVEVQTWLTLHPKGAKSGSS